MQPTVRNIDFVYDNDGNINNVGIRFDSFDSVDGTNINCQVRIELDDYNANATDLPALANLALTKLKTKLGA